MSTRDTYRIAHTARCKLRMAADSPDRNLRFILGHAFTLDSLRLRIAEIEVGGSADADSDSDPAEMEGRAVCPGAAPPPKQGAGTCGPRRVSFQEKSLSWGTSKASARRGNRSPPPPPPLDEDTESGGDDDTDDDTDDDAAATDEDEDLGLVRFGSAAAQPPRISDGEEVEAEALAGRGGGVEVGAKIYSDSELKALCAGEGDTELAKAYGRIAGCPCHGGEGPHLEKLWALPQARGALGPRMAVMKPVTSHGHIPEETPGIPTPPLSPSCRGHRQLDVHLHTPASPPRQGAGAGIGERTGAGPVAWDSGGALETQEIPRPPFPPRGCDLDRVPSTERQVGWQEQRPDRILTYSRVEGYSTQLG
ncbi:hypothetical protein JHW43_003728 [Diplocarpon mali]|nr:hypothetical protein JHW43_003728 [Diplocarpon mali]